MVTRFTHSKANTEKLLEIMGLYLSKGRAQLATDVLLAIYANASRFGGRVPSRQYMISKKLKGVPKSNIQEILKDLVRIRAIRNKGAKATVSLYAPSLDELSTTLKSHSIILKNLHNDLSKDYKPFMKESYYFKDKDDSE